MAFPSNTTRRSLSAGLSRAQSTAGSIKRIATNNRNHMAQGPITASGVLSLLDNLRAAHRDLTEIAEMNGIAEYAQEQLEVEDVATDFNSMLVAIEAASGWIITNFPRADDGALKTEDMSPQGERTERSFSSSSTAGLRTHLDTVIASID